MTSDSNLHADRIGSRQPPKSPIVRIFLVSLMTLAIFAVIACFFLPAVNRDRPAPIRTVCKNNLKQIGLALHNYSERYGAFPPAYTTDADGKPLHSWRTLILPYLDQAPLYEMIDLSKAWNDPANSEAYKFEIEVFRCPAAACPQNHATYMAIVAPGSFFRSIESRKMSDVTDDPEKTIMVVEVPADRAVHWMSPIDADEQFVLGLLTATKLTHTGGFHVACVDGSIRFLNASMPDDKVSALITIAGNEDVGEF